MKVNQLKAGSIITYAQTFLNILISMIYTPIMLRILGKSEHGLYATITSVISWISILSLGIGSSYIRYYAKYKAQGDEKGMASLNGLYLITFTVLGGIALLCGVFLSFNMRLIFADGLTFAEYSKARILGLVATVQLAISFPASIFNGIIRAQEKFIQVKTMNRLQSVCSPLLTLPILFMGYGSIGMVVITTVVDLVVYGLNIFYCFARLKVKFKFSGFEKGLLKSIAGFSIFIAINSIIGQINTSLDKILLGRYIDTDVVSVYAIGFSLYIYFKAFSSAISSMFVPRIYQIVNSKEKEKVRERLTELFTRIGRLQFFIQFLMLSGIVFFGQPFLRFWAGEGYSNSYYIALLLCVANTIPLCQGIGIEIQRAQNKHQVRTILYAIMAVVNVGLTILLIKLYGELGAPIGTAIAVIAVEVVFMNIYYHKKLNVNVIPFWLNILRIIVGFIPALAVGVAIYLFAPMHSIWLILIFILVYVVAFGLSAVFFSMNRYEKDLIFKPIKKMFRVIKNIFTRKKKVQS